MKVVFVENRQKTWFWEAIAGRLAEAGHEIGWLVQSPVFSASLGKAVRISLPDASDLRDSQDPWFDDIVRSDRNCLYFGGTTRHYEYYRARLNAGLDELLPDVVIGEASLFHELIVAKLCKDRGLPYIHPFSARYPAGRFFALLHDTQDLAAESGDVLSESDAARAAEEIGSRSTVPFYMLRPSRLPGLMKQLRLLRDRVRLLGGWIMGERYNTPSPWRRLRLTRQLARSLARWDALARMPSDPERTILYPLQMQPEANIDVLGRGLNDQLALIEQILRAAPPGVVVAVKGNPKAKYEVSEGLLRLAESSERLVLLPRTTTMEGAQRQSKGSITVTGTVGFEAIFGGARCFSLAHPLITTEFPSFAARHVSEAVERILREPEMGRGNTALGSRLMQRFISQSFPGLVSDPTSHPEVMHPQNLREVGRALGHIVDACHVAAPKSAPASL